jgi:Na+/proline symporter
MIGGTVTVLLWHNLLAPLGGVFGIYELLPAFIVSLLLIVVVSKLTPEPPAAVLEEFDTYMQVDLNAEGAQNSADNIAKTTMEALGE